MRFLEQIKELGLDKVTVNGARDHVQCCCPFHDDRVPSFSIDLRTGSWKCWSGCGSGSFMQLLAALMGSDKAPSEIVFLKEHEKKTFAPPWVDGNRMTKLFQDRGFTFDMLKEFGIGWDDQRKQMFIPVHDLKGKVVAGIWRQPNGVQPKYLNSPGMDRNQLVYGLHRIPMLVPELWVCEGPLNAVWLTAAGKYAVALFGTQFTRKQVELLLTKCPQRVILALDNDKAGAKATQNLLHWLLRKKVNVSIVELPGGANDVQDVPLDQIDNLTVKKPLQVILR